MAREIGFKFASPLITWDSQGSNHTDCRQVVPRILVSTCLRVMAPLNFLWLRHLAAFFVLFAHSFVLSGKLPTELLAFFPALGGVAVLGVTIFFIISGYLVTQSWVRQPDWTAFLRKRFLRVYPGYAACLLFSICLGAALTVVPLPQYFQADGAWSYLLNNLLLKNQLALPGVFESNPVKSAVNGSLWTIPVEVTCYLAVLAMGLVGGLSRPRVAVPVLCVALGLAIGLGQHANLFQATVFSEALPGYYAAFIFGALGFQFRNKLPDSMGLAMGLLLAVWVLPKHPVTTYASIAALGFFVINLAKWMGKRWPEGPRSIDLSYGIYLYAFPIQQALAQHDPSDSGWVLLFKTLPLCVACATFSWFCIERPALSLKTKLMRARIAG